jgi:beta-glucosidase/6-phospho-beta-glucosidase/beta-galactosidase
MDDQKESSISLFEKYEQEIKKYVTVDEFNMKQVQMDLPATRHYWVGRLMFHKQEINKLKKLRKQAQVKISEKMQEESPIGLSSKTVYAASDNHPVIVKIDEQIAENELLVEYLSKIESNFRSLSYDIKNLIEITRLETT